MKKSIIIFLAGIAIASLCWAYILSEEIKLREDFGAYRLSPSVRQNEEKSLYIEREFTEGLFTPFIVITEKNGELAFKALTYTESDLYGIDIRYSEAQLKELKMNVSKNEQFITIEDQDLNGYPDLQTIETTDGEILKIQSIQITTSPNQSK